MDTILTTFTLVALTLLLVALAQAIAWLVVERFVPGDDAPRQPRAVDWRTARLRKWVGPHAIESRRTVLTRRVNPNGDDAKSIRWCLSQSHFWLPWSVRR